MDGRRRLQYSHRFFKKRGDNNFLLITLSYLGACMLLAAMSFEGKNLFDNFCRGSQGSNLALAKC